MKLPESKRLDNEQFFFRAVIRASLVDPNDAAKLVEGDGEVPPADAYVQAFVIMATSHSQALDLLEDALKSPAYQSEHPEAIFEQVELAVLGQDQLDKEIFDVSKEFKSGVLLRSNASPIPAETDCAG